jgi:hypothetical protein
VISSTRTRPEAREDPANVDPIRRSGSLRDVDSRASPPLGDRGQRRRSRAGVEKPKVRCSHCCEFAGEPVPPRYGLEAETAAAAAEAGALEFDQAADGAEGLLVAFAVEGGEHAGVISE